MKLSMTERIYNYLVEHGPSTDTQIAAALNAKQPSVRRARNVSSRIALHAEADGQKVWAASAVAVPKLPPKPRSPRVPPEKPAALTRIPAAPETPQSRKLDRRHAVEEHARMVKRDTHGLPPAVRLARIIAINARLNAQAAAAAAATTNPVDGTDLEVDPEPDLP